MLDLKPILPILKLYSFYFPFCFCVSIPSSKTTVSHYCIMPLKYVSKVSKAIQPIPIVFKQRYCFRVVVDTREDIYKLVLLPLPRVSSGPYLSPLHDVAAHLISRAKSVLLAKCTNLPDCCEVIDYFSTDSFIYTYVYMSTFCYFHKG